MNVLHFVRVTYRANRRALHRRLVAAMSAKARAYRPVIRVDSAPRFDDRSTIDRFRRESGLR